LKNFICENFEKFFIIKETKVLNKKTFLSRFWRLSYHQFLMKFIVDSLKIKICRRFKMQILGWKSHVLRKILRTFFSLGFSVTRKLLKISPDFGEKAKKCQFFFIKAKFESRKHPHQTTFKKLEILTSKHMRKLIVEVKIS